MKYAENNFQAFILLKPLMVYSGDTSDHNMTDQRCSLDTVILTPDIITACDSRLLNKIDRRFEPHRHICSPSGSPAWALLPWPQPYCVSHFRQHLFLCQGWQREAQHVSGSGTHVPVRTLRQEEGAVLAMASSLHLCSSHGRREGQELIRGPRSEIFELWIWQANGGEMDFTILCFKMHLLITMKAADILCYCIRILSRCLDFTEQGVCRNFQFSFNFKRPHCYVWFYT